MKPKTKEQIKVFELYKRLSKAYKRPLNWAFEYVVDNVCFISTAGTANCLKCSHTWKHPFKQAWQSDIVENRCPNCKRLLDVHHTNQRTYNSYDYFSIHTTIDGYQVLRTYQMFYKMKAKVKPHYSGSEIGCLFISPTGKTTYIGKYRMNQWTDSFCGTMEVRTNTGQYFDSKAVYPKREYSETLLRNGFNGKDFHSNTPCVLFAKLLGYNKLETLWKLKLYALFRHFEVGSELVEKYWKNIMIAYNNGFNFKDPRSWFDHLKILQFFGKDIKSPKFIAPKNFNKEHQKYIDRKRRHDDSVAYEAMLKRLKEEDKIYQKHIKRYKEFSIKFDGITIEVIKSVKQLKDESRMLRHCAYSSTYHKKTDSLMLSAKKDDIVLETIEFSLRSFEVIQARGYKNKASDYNSDIVKHVNMYAQKIKELKLQKFKKKRSKTKIAA